MEVPVAGIVAGAGADWSAWMCISLPRCCLDGVWLVGGRLERLTTGDDGGSPGLSTSSSLSAAFPDSSLPSCRSVAHCLIAAPGPERSPASPFLSRNASKSSRHSWYPSERAFVAAAADVLYSLVTDRAAALKVSRMSGASEFSMAVNSNKGRRG